MIKAGIFITFVLTSLYSISADNNCAQEYIRKPPFYIVTGDKSMDNFEFEYMRDGKAQKTSEAKKNAVLPKGSIVVEDFTRGKLLTKGGHEYKPIIVVGGPEVDLDNEKHNRYKDSFTSLDLEIPEYGEPGYIYNGSLKKRSSKTFRYDPSIVPPKVTNILGKEDTQYVFQLKDDSPFVKVPGAEDYGADHFFKPAMRGDKYLVNLCFESNNYEEYKLSYVFDVHKINEDGSSTIVNQLSFNFKDMEPCSKEFLESIYPVKQDQIVFVNETMKAVKSLAPNTGPKQPIEIYAKDLVQIPIGEPFIHKGQCYFKGPYGSVHYVNSKIWCDKDNPKYQATRDLVQKELQSDSFLSKDSACALNVVLKNVQKRCPNCVVQWGDAFWEKGERHIGHEEPVCIDFRPLKDGDERIQNNLGGVNIADRSTNYSHEKTKILVEELIKVGAYSILFNDEDIKKQVNSDGYYGLIPDKSSYISKKGQKINVPILHRSHSHHLHVCFPGNAVIGDIELEARGGRKASPRVKDSYEKFIKACPTSK